MTTLLRFATGMALAVCVAGILPAQQLSDRAIVDKFQSDVAMLTMSTDSAHTVQECAEVSASIDVLERDNAAHKDLLNKALYPDDYDKTIANLRGRLLVRQNDLGVIETQVVRITALETRVRELSDQVTQLTADNEKLMGDVNRMGENIRKLGGAGVADRRMIDSLQAVVKRLQKNIEDRDQLIFALVDSIFQQYGKEVASMSDVEKKGVAGKVERRNVLSNIRKALVENILFVETTYLKGTDFAEINRQEKKFSDQWAALGPKLTQVYYGGKSQKAAMASIDTLIGQWKSKVEEATWRTLTKTFQDKGIALKPFASGQEFFQQFSAFLDDQVRNTAKAPEDVRSKLYNNFASGLWDTELKTIWLPALVESGKLTAEQQVQLEDKVDDWHSSVSPRSWIVYLLIGILVVIAAWVVARLVLKKPASPVPPAV